MRQGLGRPFRSKGRHVGCLANPQRKQVRRTLHERGAHGWRVAPGIAYCSFDKDDPPSFLGRGLAEAWVKFADISAITDGRSRYPRRLKELNSQLRKSREEGCLSS
jgi:hypothetical protein